MNNNLPLFVKRSRETNNIQLIQPGLFFREVNQGLVEKYILHEIRKREQFKLLYSIKKL
ncbi:MAG: hypothetical protein ACOC4G_10565 [Bacillota bacterium]